MALGAPPDVTTLVYTSIGAAVSGLSDPGPTVEEVQADTEHAKTRAASYETFAASGAVAWHSACVLMSTRSRFVGGAHHLAMVVRAQRTFEQQINNMIASSVTISLYGSQDTRQSSINVATTLTEQLQELGQHQVGSPSVKIAIDRGNEQIRASITEWRRAAQTDLGL